MATHTVLRGDQYSLRPEANDLTFIGWDQSLSLTTTPVDTVLVFAVGETTGTAPGTIEVKFQLDATASSETDLREALEVMNHLWSAEFQRETRFIAFVVTGHDDDQRILLRAAGSNHKVAVHTTPEGQFCVTALQ